MTPIERTSLARLESDQDHLEFSHPCFVRDHPELLTQIKRKTPTSRREDGVSNQPSKDLSAVLEEVQSLRDKQKTMENKMNELITSVCRISLFFSFNKLILGIIMRCGIR